MKEHPTLEQRRVIIAFVAKLQHDLGDIPKLATPQASEQELNRIGKALDYIDRKLEETLYWPPL